MQPETRTIPAVRGAGIVQELHHHDALDGSQGTTGPSVLYRIPLPLADDAEQSLAGCAVTSRAAALMALDRVHMWDFADQRCWDVIVCSADLAEDDLEARLYTVAAKVEMEPALLRQWVDDRPVMADRSGALARNVAAAAENRRRLMTLVRELESIGAELVVST